MRRWEKTALVGLLLLLLAGCGGHRLPCEGPSDCSGNACCMEVPITYGSGDANVFCTATPSACPPKQEVDVSRTRICRRDADCTAGPISTAESTCCPSSVLDHAVGTCHGACLPR